MSHQPPSLPSLSVEDANHLRLLSIFHYVVGGITALFSLFPLIHVAIGIGVITGAMPMNDSNGNPAEDGRMVGWVFVALGGLFILAGLTLAAFTVYAGRCLSARRRHTLCLVVAAFLCMFMPFGTVLGVFTLVVLLRPSVKAAFDAPASVHS